ncbi:hypothetical protein B5F54_15675, partial [Anaeromassilibacillus sp. An250]
ILVYQERVFESRFQAKKVFVFEKNLQGHGLGTGILENSYTESWIIPKPYFSACFHADFVQKIRDNFSSLLSWFQYFFIRSFPTFGIIL